jgi:hypothetical protein
MELACMNVCTSDAQRRRARITVRYDMVRERGRWLIDEIRGGSADKPWSIRAILKGFNGN